MSFYECTNSELEMMRLRIFALGHQVPWYGDRVPRYRTDWIVRSGVDDNVLIHVERIP